MRVVRPWPRFPREDVAAPSLAGFKARLDGTLSTLVCCKVSLPMPGVWEPDDLSGPSQAKPFYDSVRWSRKGHLRACKLSLLFSLS